MVIVLRYDFSNIEDGKVHDPSVCLWEVSFPQVIWKYTDYKNLDFEWGSFWIWESGCYW